MYFKKIYLPSLLFLLIFITGCNNITGNVILEYNSIENLLISFEDSMNERNFKELRNIFHDEDYPFILKDLYFDSNENISLTYGFPSDEELQKPLVTTTDMKYLIPGKIKYFSDDGALTAIKIKNSDKKLFTGIVLQKYKHKWKITRMYDFVVFHSNMMDIESFYLDFFRKEFDVTLKLSDEITSQNLQTTYLYNTYLLLDKIEISFHDNILCSLNKNNVHMKARGMDIIPDDNNLFMVDEFQIKGECDYASIMSPDLEDKYLLEINLILKNGIIIQGYYYGDLRL